MSIAVLDTNVLIEIEKRMWGGNREAAMELIKLLSLKYDEFWIPYRVRGEFIPSNRYSSRNKKRYYKIIEKLGNAKLCPVRVNTFEIENFLREWSNIDEGETDGILQINKSTLVSGIARNIIFISNDEKALEVAKKNSIETENFDEYLETLIEMGYY